MSDRDLDRVREAINTWTRRPPERPAVLARSRVLARLGDKRRSMAWRWVSGATAAVGLAALVLLVGLRPPSSTPVETAIAISAEPQRHPTLVYELSSGTTVYFTSSEESMAVYDETSPGEGRGDES